MESSQCRDALYVVLMGAWVRPRLRSCLLLIGFA